MKRKDDSLLKSDVLVINADLILIIFSNQNLRINDILSISLVCKLWYDQSLNNTIWNQLFIKKFAYNPSLAFEHSFFKESYKQQLIQTQELNSLCKIKHFCIGQPGLLEAIKQKNIQLIYSWLHSNHRINIKGFYNNNREELIDFISLCSELPVSLFSMIMKRNFCNAKQIQSDFLPLHFIVKFANEKALQKIFKALGDELFNLSCWHSQQNKNFIGFLSKQPGGRFELVLQALKHALGEKTLSKLLVHQNNQASCFHSAINQGQQHLLKLINYLKKEDYPIFITEGLSHDDIPVFQLALKSTGPFFSNLIELWGNNALDYLMHIHREGKTILYYALQNDNVLVLSSIRDFLGNNLIHLILKNDNYGHNILRQIIFIHADNVLNYIRATLQLLDDFNCLGFAHNLHDSPDFSNIIGQNIYIQEDELYDLFKEFGIEESNRSSFCILQ